MRGNEHWTRVVSHLTCTECLKTWDTVYWVDDSLPDRLWEAIIVQPDTLVVASNTDIENDIISLCDTCRLLQKL